MYRESWRDNTMKNFFNAIGVADMEKVHSAMIAWILDDSNDPNNHRGSHGTSNFSTFPIKERSEILCNMFGIGVRLFQSIRTHVEWNDIDIMIETNDGNRNEIWVIENKLKTPEHKSKVDSTQKTNWGISSDEIWQTEKYEYIINDYIKTLKNSISGKHFLLLSMGGDVAKSPTGKWKSLKYERWHCMLNSYPATSSSMFMIREYINSIGELINSLSNFIATPVAYPNVFMKRKKSEKEAMLNSPSSSAITPNERYILENGLETIFQKQHLIEMMVKAKLPTTNLIIDEDHGIAEFDLTIYTIKDSCKLEMYLQVQFQNGTFKAVLKHERYRNPEPNDSKEIYGNKIAGKWNGKWYDKFVDTEKVYKNNGWSLYKAWMTSINPKPRISLCKAMSIKKNQKWYDYNDPKILTSYIKGFNDAVAVINYIHALKP